MDLVADGDVAPAAAHEPALDAGQLLVADLDGSPIGFARTEVVDGTAHLEELSVHPAWSSAGIGGRLLASAVDSAAAQGHSSMTLRTYRDVPWNAPFYARRGWQVAEGDAGPELEELVHTERARGLDAWPRVTMTRTL